MADLFDHPKIKEARFPLCLIIFLLKYPDRITIILTIVLSLSRINTKAQPDAILFLKAILDCLIRYKFLTDIIIIQEISETFLTICLYIFVGLFLLL